MGKVFAGLILLFFDVNLGPVNILPDFVGFFLIHLGMKEVEECPCWQECQVTIAAIVLDFISWGLLAVAGQSDTGAVGIVLGVINLALQLAVTYRVMKGICEMEETSGICLNAEKLSKWWKLTLVCSIAAYILLWTVVFALAATVVNVVAAICYLVAYYRAWKTYEDQHPQTI